ncbi:MAG: hypothetical protein M3N24_01575 [Actinomycetota bacterium]|nr:hypothetical protein [Actinomycetota bacterium]
MTAYELGRLIGALLILIVVPLLLAFWALRLRRRGSTRWRIPAVLAVLLFLLGVAARVQQAAQEAEQVARIVEVEPESAFPTTISYRFEPIRDRELTAEIERIIRRDAPFAEVAARVVMEAETPIGFSLAITAPPEAFVGDDFMEGVARGISERSGRPPQRGTIAGRPVLQFEVRQAGNTLYGVVWRQPGTNLSMFVMAVTVADLRALAATMISAES